MKPPTDTPEMLHFNEALRAVMTVTKPELNALLNDQDARGAAAQRRGPKLKTSVSGHVSGHKD